MIKKEYLIKDMMCNNCVMHLESIETELTGVYRVQANLSKQKLTVEFDPEIINEAAIQAAIRSKGYTISE